jgi:hypothetical protein
MRWAIPGLNTRETALVVWMGALALFVLTKRDVRTSIAGLFRQIFTSLFLGAVLLGAAAYTAVTVLLLTRFGYWKVSMTKVSVLWFFGFALVVLFNTKNVGPSYFARLLLYNLQLAVVVEFVANLHTFRLPVEVLLVFLALVLVLVQALADVEDEYAQIRKPIAWCLGILTAVSVSYSIAYLIGHFDEVATGNKVKEFLLPLVLTACFVPFLLAVRYLIVWQTMLYMIRFGLRDDPRLYRFARKAIIRACGVSLAKAQLFESQFRGRLHSVSTEEEVQRVLDDFDNAWRRGRRVRAEGEGSGFLS